MTEKFPEDEKDNKKEKKSNPHFILPMYKKNTEIIQADKEKMDNFVNHILDINRDPEKPSP